MIRPRTRISSRAGALSRVGLLAAAVLLSAASGSSQSRRASPPPTAAGQYTPPASEPMDPNLAVGLYRSSFGPVKIEFDPAKGSPSVAGVWVYDREGKEVVGLFEGQLNGNVLEFQWQEPADPAPLRGNGFLVFHSDGTGFYGKWWTISRDRTGDWTGQKYAAGQQPDGAQPPPPAPEPTPYGETI